MAKDIVQGVERGRRTYRYKCPKCRRSEPDRSTLVAASNDKKSHHCG
jgi:hypothetical protein